MNLSYLSSEVNAIIENIKNSGQFRKENDFIDYKLELNHYALTDEIEIFCKNFLKDIIAFTNNKGGIIMLGFLEDKKTGEIKDNGLKDIDVQVLRKIDLNKISQKIESVTKCSIIVDLQEFIIGSRKFYYLLVEKNSQVIIPIKDTPNYNIKKGEIIHRISGKNEVANENSQNINRFLQVKANEKSKEFMEIWTKLLPEIFDINPKEILMINPKANKIYGYNQKDNNLLSSDIDIDSVESGAVTVILNAISAGEIGKISDTEGKPLYKIVGEIKEVKSRDYISLSTLQSEIKRQCNFIFTNQQLKLVFKFLKWTNVPNFKVEEPNDSDFNNEFSNFIWIENTDTIKMKRKVVFSKEAIPETLKIINDETKHQEVFNKLLNKKPKE